MTIVGPFKEGTVPGLQPQGGFLREQEGLCTLQKQPRETTAAVAGHANCVVIEIVKASLCYILRVVVEAYCNQFAYIVYVHM